MLLNHLSRDYIFKQAMKISFDKRESDLRKRDIAIGNKVWKLLFGKFAAHINALPSSWYSQGDADATNNSMNGNEFTVNICGEQHRLRTDQRLPARSGWGYVVGTSTDRGILDEVHAHSEDWAAFHSDKRKATETLQAVLKSVKTTEKLLEVWPEGKRCLKGIDAFIPTPPGVPALLVSDMNKMLGLAA